MVFHARMKHIEINYYFIHDHIKSHEIFVHKVPFDNQIVDIFTKLLLAPHFTLLRDKLAIYQTFTDSLKGKNRISSLGTSLGVVTNLNDLFHTHILTFISSLIYDIEGNDTSRSQV